MSKTDELQAIKSKWDALNLADLEHDATALAMILIAKAGGKTFPPQEAQFFYGTLQDFLVMTLAKVQEYTARNVDQYPFDWDMFTGEMELIFRDWESNES